MLKQKIDKLLLSNGADPINWNITAAELTHTNEYAIRGRRSGAVLLLRSTAKENNWASKSVARCEARYS